MPIAMHHAFHTIRFTKATMLTVLLLPVVFDFILWWQLDNIISFWHDILVFWSEMMDVGDPIVSHSFYLLFSSADLPIISLSVAFPTKTQVNINLLASIAIFILTVLLPERMTPISYLIRVCVLIHLSAVVYFVINPSDFPYQLEEHLSGGLGLGIYILFIIPPLLGLVHYIFDFSIYRKILITILMLGYFILLIPMQYLLHALILHQFSMIFLPILYLMFGLLLNVLSCVSLYSYAMSWKKQETGYFINKP